MNILIIRPEEIIDGKTIVTGRRLRHIISVLKAETGSVIKAGILGGGIGTAVIEYIDSEKAVLIPSCEGTPPEAPDIRVVLALPRPKVFRRILFGIACAGVKEIHLINTWRVDKSYWDSPYLSGDKIEETFIEALEQSKDTIMPKLHFNRFFMNFINETVPSLPMDNRYFAHPYADSAKEIKKPSTVVIGCEGGFIDKEVNSLIGCGFHPFSLGERILTTEYAVPYILGMMK